jgi:hypothetical protein
VPERKDPDVLGKKRRAAGGGRRGDVLDDELADGIASEEAP